MKIAVIGYSGSGKSTLAGRLGALYEAPVLHLDRVQFIENWQERDREEALALVCAFMRQPAWIIDGNYTAFLQAERFAQADHIVYMDFGRFACLARALKRYLRYRNTTRESMAPGCNEKLDPEFIWWLLYEGRTRQKREHYRRTLDQYGDKVTVLKNQKQLDAFLRCPFVLL